MDATQYYLPYIKKEQRAFREVLNNYFPNEQGQNPRILDICCGIANEEPLLIRHFGENTELLSLDWDPLLKKFLEPLGRKSVVIGDIRKLKKFAVGKYQIVIGRNIPLNPNDDPLRKKVPDPWPEIFENLTKYMIVESRLFLTLARHDEFNRARNILSKSGYRINVDEENQIKVPSDYIGVCGADVKDNYVIIAQPLL